MPPEDITKSTPTSDAELEAKRLKARAAMESYEHKVKREAAEKLVKQKELEATKLQAHLEEERRRAEAKAAALKQAEIDRQEAEAKLVADRLQRMKEATSAIDAMKNDPTLSLSPIRTFKSDLAKAVADEKVSVANIAVKEHERNNYASNLPETSSKPWLTIIIIVLMAIGASGIGYYVWTHRSGAVAVGTNTVSSLIPAQNSIALDTANAGAASLLSQINQIKAGVEPNHITNVYFTNGSSTLPLSKALQALNITLPNAVMGYLQPNFMIGVYGGNGGSVFLILKNNRYDSTKFAITDNESEFARVLTPLVGGQTISGIIDPGAFQDKTIHNVDIRTLGNASGTMFLYSFLDQQTIIVTSNEAALTSILTAYNNPSTL